MFFDWMVLWHRCEEACTCLYLWECRAGSCTLLHEFSQQVAPLAAEDVGSGEAAVSAAHTQVSDAALEQVKRRGQTALARGEGFTAGAADDGAALTTITTSVGQMKHYNSMHCSQPSINTRWADAASIETVKQFSFRKLWKPYWLVF